MPKSKGSRFRMRRLGRKRPRTRGLPPLGSLLREYKLGTKVDIVIEPSVQKGQPHRRYQGKTAVVVEKRGRAYVLATRSHKKPKTIISRPEHLRPHKG